MNKNNNEMSKVEIDFASFLVDHGFSKNKLKEIRDITFIMSTTEPHSNTWNHFLTYLDNHYKTKNKKVITGRLFFKYLRQMTNEVNLNARKTSKSVH